MAKNVECKYRVTATIKAETQDELEVIKAKLIRAGANILRIAPITKSLQARQNTQLDLGLCPFRDD
jgi:hypothetical protein